MIRAGLWLRDEVGEGGKFTKAELRAAFPDVAQIDRRVRDLRDRGWQIDTNRQDPSLNADEQRLVKMGVPVWLPGQSKAPEGKASLTDSQRNKLMLADGFLCRSCGIGAGESYADGDQGAQLDVARRKVLMPDGTTQTQPVTECNRCRVGSGGRTADLSGVITTLEKLSALEREVFAGWLKADRRDPSPMERLWGEYRTLPDDARHAVWGAVDGMSKQSK
ncbi:hypothetical protein HRW14_13670 [Streptomyces lunaelactis]|nr:hypothetical protein [Streptomyces lunaelactis]NUK18384.1 hypothetical protein [Streptomyces lunaelactis]NUK51301.1 hypothetical protein [Streptomyces lunaelactis]NUK64683.1 hypothetical protein [Streptomyces lunaelactis]